MLVSVDTFNSTSSSSALSSLSLTNSSYLPNLTHSSKATPPSTASIPSNPLPSSSSSSFSPSSSSSPTPLPPSSLSFPISSSHSTQPFSLAILRLLHRRHRPDLRSPSQRHHLRANLRSHLSPLSNPRLPAQALCCRCGTRAAFCLQGLWVLQTGLSLYVEAFIPERCHELLDVLWSTDFFEISGFGVGVAVGVDGCDQLWVSNLEIGVDFVTKRMQIY
ncbi:hypothetical protein CFP56_014149 [Quercus suber]|uniref:Uncharacterized protein n=1 Tax=Quercus suber TaxID=58331 RepID=A0AAW0KV99_QUESU